MPEISLQIISVGMFFDWNFNQEFLKIVVSDLNYVCLCNIEPVYELISKLFNKKKVIPFVIIVIYDPRVPVNTEEVDDYLETVKEPMDLEKMHMKLDDGEYKCAQVGL